MLSLDSPRTNSLWITPSLGDESQCLLAWNAEAEHFELPTFTGRSGNAADLRRRLARQWPELGEYSAALGDPSAANLPDIPEMVYALHIPADQSFERSTGLAWVPLREVLMGFTQGCRVVDSGVRQFLEQTGRAPVRCGRDERLLTVGVAGNRELPMTDLPVLFDRLHQALGDLRREFPGRTLRMMSSLGQGAEQIMADVALELQMPLIVPLPVPLEIYETEFPGRKAREEFRNMLDRAHCWYVLPQMPGTTEHDLRQRDVARNEQQARTGQYVVDQCDVLMAVWDGEPSNIRGTPADILRYALRPLPRPDRRLLIRHLPVRRSRGWNRYV